MVDIFIGYDEREDRAYHVCAASIMRRTSISCRIHALDQKMLRAMGLYWRPWRWEASDTGSSHVKVDQFDGRPFSTDFAFTRFLVPALMSQWQRPGPALFVDCDFLFREDVARLFELFDPTKTIQVVKHDYRPPERSKMDGQHQQIYPRKNWSSLILWNTDKVHLPVSVVNGWSGRKLHGFDWLADNQIGELPEAWNWLEGHSSEDIEPCAVHFTRGGPWFLDWQNVAYADEWLAEEQGYTSE